MAAEGLEAFSVGSKGARSIPANGGNEKRVVNAGAAKLFYKATSDVSTADTEIAVGGSIRIEQTTWVISDSECRVLVEDLASASSVDETEVREIAEGVIEDLIGVTVAAQTDDRLEANSERGLGFWEPESESEARPTTHAHYAIKADFTPVNAKDDDLLGESE